MIQFKKKKKHNTQLVVGVKTQLCKECEELNRRLCEVEGKLALFHRWLEDEKELLTFGSLVRPEEMERLNHVFRAEHYAPARTTITIIKKLVALVEYQDGTVAKVEPEKVRFVHKEGAT